MINKIFSVESRKGGVGKTTAALYLAEALQTDFKVFLIDCDITGTSVSQAVDGSSYWNESKVHTLKTREGKEHMNLLSIYSNYILKGEALPTDQFEFDEGKINILGSDLYESNKLIVDPKVLMDEMHSYIVLKTIKDIINLFEKNYSESPCAIILDNSPGFVGLNKAIHDWMTDLGPENAKFMIVSSLDKQDVSSSVNSAASIISVMEDKIATADSFFKTNQEPDEKIKIRKGMENFFQRVKELKANFENVESGKNNYLSVIFNKVPERISPDYLSTLLPTYNAVPSLSNLFGEDNEELQNYIIQYDRSIESQFYSSALPPQESPSKRVIDVKSKIERALEFSYPNLDVARKVQDLIRVVRDVLINKGIKLPFDDSIMPRYPYNKIKVFLNSLDSDKYNLKDYAKYPIKIVKESSATSVCEELNLYFNKKGYRVPQGTIKSVVYSLYEGSSSSIYKTLIISILLNNYVQSIKNRTEDYQELYPTMEQSYRISFTDRSFIESGIIPASLQRNYYDKYHSEFGFLLTNYFCRMITLKNDCSLLSYVFFKQAESEQIIVDDQIVEYITSSINNRNASGNIEELAKLIANTKNNMRFQGVITKAVLKQWGLSN